MNTVSQNCRSASLISASNPTGLMSDVLALSDKLSGSGAPDPSLGVINNTYYDTSNNIEYVKRAGGWQPYVDLGSLPIPDPLAVGSVETNLCKTDELEFDIATGRLNDNMLLDGRTTGTIQVISENIGQCMQIGTSASPDNIIFQNNGYANIKSGARMYDLQLDNYAGRQLKLEAQGEYKIKVQGTPDVLKVESALDNDIQLVTDGTGKVSVVKNLGGQIDIDPQNNKISSNASPFTLSSNITNVESLGGSLNLKAGGLTQVQDLLSGKNIVLDPTSGTIAGNPDAPFVIQNVQANQDLDLKTAGTGQINLRSGTSQIVCHNILECNTFGLSTSSINASQTYTEAKALIANGAGALAWSKLPETAVFTAVNVGSNSNTYLSVSSLATNPADVPVYPVLQPGTKIRRLEACLMSSVAWSWNGGDARIKLGYVQENLPCTDANFVSVLEFPINTASPWYFTLAIPNVAVNAGTHKLACRLDASGTAATNTQAELIVKVTVAD